MMGSLFDPVETVYLRRNQIDQTRKVRLDKNSLWQPKVSRFVYVDNQPLRFFDYPRNQLPGMMTAAAGRTRGQEPDIGKFKPGLDAILGQSFADRLPELPLLVQNQQRKHQHSDRRSNDYRNPPRLVAFAFVRNCLQRKEREDQRNHENQDAPKGVPLRILTATFQQKLLGFRAAHSDDALSGSHFSPSTSCMSYNPGFCFTTHCAARSAPKANVSRLEALCVSSRRSPVPAKMTV